MQTTTNKTDSAKTSNILYAALALGSIIDPEDPQFSGRRELLTQAEQQILKSQKINTIGFCVSPLISGSFGFVASALYPSALALASVGAAGAGLCAYLITVKLSQNARTSADKKITEALTRPKLKAMEE